MKKIFINLKFITFHRANITQRDAYYCYQGTTSWVVKCCQISQSTVLKRIGKPLFRSTTSVSFNWFPCWPNSDFEVFMKMPAGKSSNKRVCNMQRPMMSLRTWSLPCRRKLFFQSSIRINWRNPKPFQYRFEITSIRFYCKLWRPFIQYFTKIWDKGGLPWWLYFTFKHLTVIIGKDLLSSFFRFSFKPKIL